ncbi:MAG: hypothetical protein HGA36_01775 [Candidatus Moranbacteria bacterium]|nr:hypothetical protein [Candidatus Moranbacteria bacterium]
MGSSAAAFFASTIGKCQNVSIDVDSKGEQSISIELHPAANAISLIHGVVLKFTNNSGTILEAGIATMLINAKCSFFEKIMAANERHLLVIPIKSDVPLINATHVTFYMQAGGRILSKEFKLQ